MFGDPKPVDYLAETTAILAGAATGNYTSWDHGPSPTPYDEFTAMFNSDQASAANGAKIQGCDDNATWKDIAATTLTANVPAQLTTKVVCRYMRAVLVQGATGNTVAPTVRTMRRKAAKGFGGI